MKAEAGVAETAPGGIWDEPGCDYLLCEQAGDTVDVALTVGELLDRLAADWPELAGDLVVWQIPSEDCPAPKVRAVIYGTPAGPRALWL